MTNSTTGIGTVKLISNREGKIISIGHDVVYGGVEVWLLELTYAPLEVQWFTVRPARSIQFRRQTGTFKCHRPVVYFLLLHCYISRQTQHYRPKVLVLHSALPHVLAVHISHQQAGISTNKQRCKLL